VDRDPIATELKCGVVLATPRGEVEAITVDATAHVAVLEDAVVRERDVVVRADSRERDQLFPELRDDHRPGHTFDGERAQAPGDDVTELADTHAQRHRPSVPLPLATVDEAWST